jgi:hypothetical protein
MAVVSIVLPELTKTVEKSLISVIIKADKKNNIQSSIVNSK